ncbi:hypothetical protein SteCoe_26416 [Stentor coeruleus]|uniref:Uncharacterized protein n=1 Tax=Stentor coeruleus TaxID=5963 RepID=A0A1R2BCX3_9CILI|nr:hypothetical protein SteCoe_26416 [Stentor coeruleus]
MNCGITGLFCCIQPTASATFQHTKLEYSGGKAYMDVFCQVDGTVILDTDYLCLNKPPQLNISNKYFIAREPGNMSGVARVTFPYESGTYNISYMRTGNHSVRVLGELKINVPPYQRDSTGMTFDTEGYSPRFRPSLTKRCSLTSVQDSTKYLTNDNEITPSANYDSLNDRV